MTRLPADKAIGRGPRTTQRACATACLIVLGALAAAACRSKEGAPAPGASLSSAPSASALLASPAPSAAGEPRAGDGDIKPAYPRSVPPDPQAARLCAVLHDLPATRRAECCSTSPGFAPAGECTRMLSFALREKTVTLDPGDVDRCAEAMQKAYEGCDWVGPNIAPAPAACLGILKGTLKAGATCRSALDCEAGLSCRGAGPTSLGRCAPPSAARTPCDLAVDSLVVYTRQDDAAATSHPQCSGYCMRRRCFDTVPPGSACTLAAECGPSRACIAGKCAEAPLPAAGKPCAGDACADGVRCLSGRCVAPKASGEACALDQECRAACVRQGGAGGRCGMRCAP